MINTLTTTLVDNELTFRMRDISNIELKTLKKIHQLNSNKLISKQDLIMAINELLKTDKLNMKSLTNHGFIIVNFDDVMSYKLTKFGLAYLKLKDGDINEIYV